VTHPNCVLEDDAKKRAAWPNSTADDTRDDESIASHMTPRVIEGVGARPPPKDARWEIGSVTHPNCVLEDDAKKRAAWPNSTADDTRDDESIASHMTPRVIEGVGARPPPRMHVGKLAQ